MDYARLLLLVWRYYRLEPGQVPDGDLVPMLQELQALQRVIAAVSADLAAEAETRSLYLR
ncbi:hypothetical protein [Allokutzneria albata]|uniref:hypothetical protein n=1 Tax=Allokutzneria albata TaxID=211114 RepID=UPI0004C3B734|nr:hypothetical protein [Allokutzneria albata]